MDSMQITDECRCCKNLVPLTDEEIGQIILQQQITLVNYVCSDKQTEFARAIEAAHGIKE